MRYESFPRSVLIAAPVALVVILLTVLLTSSDSAEPVAQAAASASNPTGAIATDQNLKVAFIGDTANGANFQSVLGLIQSEGADVIMHQGDFDYSDNPNDFFATITGALGPTYPYLASVGNHDEPSWADGCGDPDGCYATLLKQRFAASGIAIDDPDLNDEQYSTDFHGLGMYFIGQGTQLGNCGPSAGYECFLRTGLQTDRHIWRICSWHKNQQAMQIGGKADEMSWGVYDACTDLSAIIATAHEHSYQRTVTMTNPQTQTIDTVQHPLVSGVPSNPNSLRVKPGSSFVFVSGLGGNSMRDQTRCLPATYPYGCNHEWASIYTNNQTNNVAKFGALFIEFFVDGDPYKARAYFKTTTGETIDSFEIRADYHDADGDGIQDGIDNCPTRANPAQAPIPWTIPAGDADCDGFPDSVSIGPPNAQASEAFVGTDATRNCAGTSARNDEPLPDAWPVDFDDNQKVNGSDLLMLAPVFGGISPNPPYNARFDLNADGRINGSDFLSFSPFFYKSCASPAAPASVQRVAWMESPPTFASAEAVAQYRCDFDESREVRVIGPPLRDEGQAKA